MSSGDSRPVSPTHERAVLKQGNGELQEDVVVKEPRRHQDGEPDHVDEQSKASFPASDPPSSWADAPPADRGAKRAPSRHDRVVERREVTHPPERVAPDDPVPGTLPGDPG